MEIHEKPFEETEMKVVDQDQNTHDEAVGTIYDESSQEVEEETTLEVPQALEMLHLPCHSNSSVDSDVDSAFESDIDDDS